MKNKTSAFYCRMTEQEKKVLARNARMNHMTVSEYIRARCIYTTDGRLPVIDTAPLSKAVWELHKVGTNFNQLMRNFNKYGIGGYDSEHASLVMDKIADAISSITDSMIAIRREADRHRIHINAKDGETDDRD